MENRQATKASRGRNIQTSPPDFSVGSRQGNSDQIPNSEDTPNETLEEKVARLVMRYLHQELRQVRRTRMLEQQTAEEELGEYADTCPTTGKRKRALSSLQNQNIYVERSRSGNSSLTINGKLIKFKSGADFSAILRKKGRAYFDRTRYISVLDAYDDEPILFFRPRRFGKSLTVNMLEHFHGLQYRDEHRSSYQDLDVQKDITEGRVTPGQFFTLKFDFSTANRSPNLEQADLSLKDHMNNSFSTFYTTYAMYLDEDVSELHKKINHKDPAQSLWACVSSVNGVLKKARETGDKRLANIQGIYLLVDEYDSFSNDYFELNITSWEGTAAEQTFKSFWSMVKLLLGPTNGISRAFITGISPLSINGIGSGFNVARNISFHKNVAGLCGLTREDIEAALNEISGLDTEACENHLSALTKSFNGYHFCRQTKVEKVYNTETCLNYIQSIIEGEEPEFENPENSEVSELFLRRFTGSPSAIKDFQEALETDEEGGFRPFLYEDLKQNFKLADLNRNIQTSAPAWRSLTLYFGGFTFYAEDPSHYLKIPNLIAARRIAETVLYRYGLLESLNVALKSIEIDGDVRPVWSCYRDLMLQRDVGHHDFDKSEEIHRDSFYFSLLQNHFHRPRVEFKVTKPFGKPGRIDLLVPVRRHMIVIELKVARIDYLDIPVTGGRIPNRDNKALVLKEYMLPQVLQLKFNNRDKFHNGKSIQQWIDSEAAQLRGYITSTEVVKKVKDGGFLMKAHLVVIVGSRHILVYDMDRNGKLADPDHIGENRYFPSL